MKKMKVQQGGFTLVEIAIVLVIIGLLLGAVFKGQELIAQAKVKNAYKQLDEVQAAHYTYIDKNGSVPGDSVTAPDGIPDSDAGYWGALYTDGILNGDPNAATVVGPNNPYGVAIQVSGTTLRTCTKVPETVAVQIEKKHDNNKGEDGQIIYLGTTAPAGPGTADTGVALPATPTENLAWICSKL